MGSTNKTPNVGLSQFEDVDKPTWRGDYNADMFRLDGEFVKVRTEISGVTVIADAARTIANAAQATAEQAATDLTATKATVDAHTTAIDAATARVTALDSKVTAGLSDRYTKAEADARFAVSPVAQRPIAIFIGNSHTSPATASWPNDLSAEMGWEPRNYAVSGTGFTYGGAGQYSAQLGRAAADLNPAEVAKTGFVIIADAGNDIRGAASVSSQAVELFTEAQNKFPNARVICIPAFWGSSSSQNNMIINKEYLNSAVVELQEACVTTGTEFVDDSWTWHWGRSDLMDANDIHYTPAGKKWIVGWMLQYFKGASTRYDQRWNTVSPAADVGLGRVGGYRAMGAKRDGNYATLQGIIGIDADKAAGALLFRIPEGRRPIYDFFADLQAHGSYDGEKEQVWIKESGDVLANSNITGGKGWVLNVTYPVL